MAAAAAVLVIGAAGFGTVSWNYMQHDNAFCTGCHIMKGPFQRFTGSKHDSLSCHACHQQSIFASARQLYLWVADRPQQISMHAKVPTRVCAGCHVQGDKEKEKWKRIATTAGHRVHLESDSSALRNVQCTTCHGLEVHRFVPVDSTCGQSGCHISTEIRLGKMAGQTGFHCIASAPAHMNASAVTKCVPSSPTSIRRVIRTGRRAACVITRTSRRVRPTR